MSQNEITDQMTFVSHAYLMNDEAENKLSGRYGYILYLIMGICVVFMMIFEENHFIPMMIILICLAIEIFLKFNRFNIDKKAKKVIGSLEINELEIKLKERKIKISDIQKISLRLTDFENKITPRYNLDFRGMYSDGVNNYIDILTKNGERIYFNFRLNSKKHKLKLIGFFKALIAHNLLSMDEVIKILEISESERKLLEN